MAANANAAERAAAAAAGLHFNAAHHLSSLAAAANPWNANAPAHRNGKAVKFLIHLADPQSLPVVITIFTRDVSTFPLFKISQKQNNFQVKILIA